MIDIHCHILPGIDDGPSDSDESVEMARIAAGDGITKIVATPHIKNTLHPVSVIKTGIERLNSRLTEQGIPVEIVPGADVNRCIPAGRIYHKRYTIHPGGVSSQSSPEQYERGPL